MRKIEEIDKEIKGIDEKINALNEQRRTLVIERNEREFADFCEKYDVKKGDVVHIDRCGDVIIEGIDKTWSDGLRFAKSRRMASHISPLSMN